MAIHSRNLHTRFMENIHVGLWLVKDLSWMMEYKILGCVMIVPTISLAIWICYRSRHQAEVWINIAVLLWILANASWMVMEFFQIGNKTALLPLFILGLISFSIYLYRYHNATYE